MADPRDTARQWLAEIIASGHVPTEPGDWTAEEIADAILSAPGVEVEPAYEHDPTGPRTAILLPMEEGTGT